MNNLGTRNSELETLKIIAVIPARYAASRFPGKLMKILGDKTVIATTYQNVLETQLFDEVFVATDSEIIFDEITKVTTVGFFQCIVVKRQSVGR